MNLKRQLSVPKENSKSVNAAVRNAKRSAKAQVESNLHRSRSNFDKDDDKED